MKEYKVKLNIDGYVRIQYISLEDDLTNNEVKEAVSDYIKDLFDWSYEEVINE